MASVYYLFDDAIHIADDIIEQYSQENKYLKNNHIAAIIIQRTFRGYVVRKSYRDYVRTVIVLQKYIRGWLARYHLPERMQEYFDRRSLQRYNAAATKLQAAWKGVLVRFEIDIKQIMKDKRMNMRFPPISMLLDGESSDDLQGENNASQTSSEIRVSLFEGAPTEEDNRLKKRIIDIMFDRHHLLSTEVRRGVLKCNSELQEIEKILKSLPWKDYISNTRKIYYKYQKIKEQNQSYMFADKTMRKAEDMLKLRDKSHDRKDVYMGNCIADNRKPFTLSMKLDEHAYEASLINKGQYIKRERNITRTEDKSRNITDKDFILTLKEIVKECQIPPYYVDFWYKQCTEHQFVD